MSYTTHGSLNETLLSLFTATTGYASSAIKPMCGWRDASGVVRVGCWKGNWQAVENAWSWDRWGKWANVPPLLYQAQGLTVVGAATTQEGNDTVFQVASGASFTLDWFRKWVSALTGERSGQYCKVFIYKCSDGSVAREIDTPTVPLAQATLPDGSYVVYVQYFDVLTALKLPPDYVPIDDYYYTNSENQRSYFDPYAFVGQIPSDPNNPLNILRAQLVATNKQEDNPAYSQYLSSESAQDGEGSAIKLQVGGGTWTLAANTYVTPSRPLYSLDFDTTVTLPEGTSPSTLVPIYFDEMAHVVSFVLHTRIDGIWGGKVLLGGARLTANGPSPSLWQWNADNTATLLGTAQESCQPLCEQEMSTGLVTGLTELEDGSIIMLTFCSRHIYDATGATINDRLPRWPLQTDGEPGGRSMLVIGNRVIHTTEALGKQPDPLTPSFYNVVVDLQGNDLVYAPGTLTHLDGSLWKYRGKAYGVRCDGDPTLEATREQVTFYDGIWNKSAPPWAPTLLVLQRGASINGNNVIFGWEPSSETAQVIIDDGVSMTVKSSNYRVRGGTVTNNSARTDLQSYIMPARKVISGALDTAWSLIETDGSDGNLPTPDPLDDIVGGDGRFYRVLQIPANDAQIYSLQIRDMMTSKALQAANADPNETSIGVRLRVDSDAALDDFSSYIYRPLLDRRFTLPIAANSKVELIVISHAALAPEQMPEVGENG